MALNAYGMGIGYNPPSYSSPDKLYIKGNVGIGTNSPSAKLDVNSIDVAAFFKSGTNSVPVSVINGGDPVSTIGYKESDSSNEYNVRVGANNLKQAFAKRYGKILEIKSLQCKYIPK